MTSPQIQLTSIQYRVASHIGTIRNDEAKAQGRAADFNENAALKAHQMGARGECAFARWVDKFWPMGVNTFKKPDVGNYEVRTASPHAVQKFGCKVKTRDEGSTIIVFLTEITDEPERAVYQILGWVYADEAQKEEYLKDPNNYGRSNYFIPMEKINDIDKLPQK